MIELVWLSVLTVSFIVYWLVNRRHKRTLTGAILELYWISKGIEDKLDKPKFDGKLFKK